MDENFSIVLPRFSLRDTLFCGQSFLWEETAPDTFSGSFRGIPLTVSQKGDIVTFHNTNEQTYRDVWMEYFDLNTDYDALKAIFSTDPTLKKAIAYCGGIRILKQDPWETVCAFILSQNNNIKRITGIVKRFYAWGNGRCPTPSMLSSASIEDLTGLRAGFRAKYLIDAGKKVESGAVSLKRIAFSSYEEGKKELQTILGIGPKVADCILLFGFHHIEAVPADVWIKRVLARYYPDGLPKAIRPYGGIAQQYLFFAARAGILE